MAVPNRLGVSLTGWRKTTGGDVMGRGSREITSAKGVKQAERRAEMVRLRAEGLTLEQIGQRFGIRRDSVYHIIKGALDRMVREPTEELRALELARCDELWAEAMKTVKAFHPVMVQGGRVLEIPVVTPDGQPVLDEAGKPVTTVAEDHMPKLGAINTALKVMERRARLMGLDAPQRMQGALTVEGGANESIFQHLPTQQLMQIYQWLEEAQTQQGEAHGNHDTDPAHR